MRKLVITLASTLILAALPVASVAAHGYYRPSPVEVYGTVTNDGRPVSHALVTVSCDGHSKWGTTNRRGQYDITFPGWQCATGDTITVTASRHDESGMNSGVVTKCHNIRLNVAFVSAVVPEFGLLTGISAVAIGGGIALIIRKRKLGENS